MLGYLLVNFGGPRNLKEIRPFLQNLLTDEEVIRPTLFKPFHNLLFTYIARKRAKTIAHDYQTLGGKSPIYEDTENLAKELEERLKAPVITFHRYLPETHKNAIALIENKMFSSLIVFPLFPQFSYATTGSVARFFSERLSKEALEKLQWVKSYPSHPAFISLWKQEIEKFLQEKKLDEKECHFLFSAHGLPEKFIEEGDPYVSECEFTFNKIAEAFPLVKSQLCFQSQFGREKWIGPATLTLSQEVASWAHGRQHIVFIPISFTSDHIETLFEIEKIYIPLVEEKGFRGHRIPTCYPSGDFSTTITSILKEFAPQATSALVRK